MEPEQIANVVRPVLRERHLAPIAGQHLHGTTPFFGRLGLREKRKQMSVRLSLVLLWLALSAVQGAAGSPSKIAITHVTVIDVRTGTNKKDMTVLIVGDRISAIRAAKEKEKLPTKEIEVIEKTASVLLLEGNRLQDIRNTQRIVAVISEGRYLNRDGLERLRRENCRTVQQARLTDGTRGKGLQTR